MSQQRILIVIESGKLLGASVTTDTGSPVPLDLSALGKLLPEINSSAVATLDSIEATHAEAIAAKDAELAATKAALEELTAYKDAMVKQVATVLASNDPAQYEALARAFLTPAQEKERSAELARAEALKAEAAEIEAKYRAEAVVDLPRPAPEESPEPTPDP